MHRERRKFLRSALKELATVLSDQPGLLGPKVIDLIHMSTAPFYIVLTTCLYIYICFPWYILSTSLWSSPFCWCAVFLNLILSLLGNDFSLRERLWISFVFNLCVRVNNVFVFFLIRHFLFLWRYPLPVMKLSGYFVMQITCQRRVRMTL